MASRGSYDSVGRYLPFDPDSTFRFWPRYRTPTCIDAATVRASKEKMKLAVLGKLKNTVCANRNMFVEIQGIKYVIDPLIYSALLDYLKYHPANNLADLQTAISAVRSLTNNPGPLMARVKSAPLTTLRPCRTYTSTGDKAALLQQTDYLKPKKIGPDFKVGNAVPAFFSQISLINAYSGLFVERRPIPQHGHFIYVQSDDFCEYIQLIQEIKKSRAGKSIVASEEATWIPASGIVDDTENLFKPVLTFLTPVNNVFTGSNFPVKYGILFGFNDELINKLTDSAPVIASLRLQVGLNSELVFIPFQRDTDIIENKNIFSDSSVRFPITNGGHFENRDTDCLKEMFEKKIDELPIRATQGLYI